MSVVKELIREEKNGKLSFGDYTLTEKSKKSDFAYKGDSYKIKTFMRLQSLKRMAHLFMNQYQELL